MNAISESMPSHGANVRPSHSAGARATLWALLVAVPVAALVALGVERLAGSAGSRPVRRGPSIRDVPARPPLWHVRSTTVRSVNTLSPSPVPPESPHAPPQPRAGRY